MKKIKKTYRNSETLYILLTPFRFFYRFFKYYIIPDKVAIKRKFIKRLGYKPNFKKPQNFSEKMQWLKLNDRQDWYHLCADKYRVREYVTDKLGTDKYLIPLYFETTDWRQITPNNLPDKPFVIKCNHDNSSHKIIYNKSDIDWKALRFFYRMRLNAMSFYWVNREFSYKGIKPRVMVEKLLENKNGEIYEFKFYSFNGSIKFVQYSLAKQGKEKEFRYLDSNFSPLSTNHTLDSSLKITESIDIPKDANEMKNVAETIAKKFPYHIRVDFYSVDEQFYIGELTFFDSAGYMEISPDDWAKELSDALVINPNCIHTK